MTSRLGRLIAAAALLVLGPPVLAADRTRLASDFIAGQAVNPEPGDALALAVRSIQDGRRPWESRAYYKNLIRACALSLQVDPEQALSLYADRENSGKPGTIYVDAGGAWVPAAFQARERVGGLLGDPFGASPRPGFAPGGEASRVLGESGARRLAAAAPVARPSPRGVPPPRFSSEERGAGFAAAASKAWNVLLFGGKSGLASEWAARLAEGAAAPEPEPGAELGWDYSLMREDAPYLGLRGDWSLGKAGVGLERAFDAMSGEHVRALETSWGNHSVRLQKNTDQEGSEKTSLDAGVRVPGVGSARHQEMSGSGWRQTKSVLQTDSGLELVLQDWMFGKMVTASYSTRSTRFYVQRVASEFDDPRRYIGVSGNVSWKDANMVRYRAVLEERTGDLFANAEARFGPKLWISAETAPAASKLGARFADDDWSAKGSYAKGGELELSADRRLDRRRRTGGNCSFGGAAGWACFATLKIVEAGARP